MRFKNYTNSYTKNNRIYSKNDIANMSVKDAFGKKRELMAQNRSIGIPTETELQNSDNVVWVNAYTRDDGTEVKGYYRSKPDGEGINNLTKRENQETKIEENNMEKVEVNPENNYQEQNQEINKQTEKIKQEDEKDKRLYPDEVAGVKRSKEMSFEEADGGKVNPNYVNTTYDKDGEKYYNNCQSCVIAYEARRRGYDVEAAPYDASKKTGELGNTLFEAWMDPNTDEVCDIGTEINVIEGDDCYKILEKEVKQGERYALVDAHFVKYGNEDKRVDAHVRVVEREGNGDLIMYDPQEGSVRKGEDMKEYINKWMGPDADLNPQYLRIDNKKFNPYYINEVVVSKKIKNKK